MSADPYAPPQAVLLALRSDPPMPRTIRWQIMSGVYATRVNGVLALGGVLRMLGSNTPAVYIVYNLTAAIVILGLGYGISRGGRTCAVLALSTFVLSRVVLLGRDGLSSGWPLWLAVLCCYTLSVIGTLRWHTWRDAHRRASSAL